MPINPIARRVRAILADERGATAIEYALVATFIAVALAASFLALGEGVNSQYEYVGTEYRDAANN